MERKGWEADEVFAQVLPRAAESDPVLMELAEVLDEDPLYQQVCAELDRRKPWRRRLGWRTTQGEVLLRMLLVAYLYDWSAQETAEQVEDSLVLRWFCRLGLQPALPESLVSQATDQVSVAVLEALVNRVEQARERARKSEGRLRPTYRQRWR
jgi:transposase, IS5 family